MNPEELLKITRQILAALEHRETGAEKLKDEYLDTDLNHMYWRGRQDAYSDVKALFESIAGRLEKEVSKDEGKADPGNNLNPGGSAADD